MNNVARNGVSALAQEIRSIRRQLEMPGIREQIRDAAIKKVKDLEEPLRRLLEENSHDLCPAHAYSPPPHFLVFVVLLGLCEAEQFH
jgi:hypothetical protein